MIFMKIALPVLRDSVAPRFDCTEEFLIVEIDQGNIVQRYILECPERNVLKRALMLIQVPVKVIICGRIDNFSLRLFQDRNLKVITGQYGLLDAVLQYWLNTF